jgi:hypothetical protein
MAAVMTTPSPVDRCSAGAPAQPNHLTLVPMPPAGLGRPPRVSATTYWRRRLAVALGAVFVVLIAGQAGAALRSSPLEAPGRPPAVVRHVVEPGDSLWTVAGQVAPEKDPREVVDQLQEARDGAPLLVGETIVWQR